MTKNCHKTSVWVQTMCTQYCAECNVVGLSSGTLHSWYS